MAALQSFEWLLAMLQVSLAPGLLEGVALPQIVCYDELEGMDSIMWLGMENAIIVNDRSAGCALLLPWFCYAVGRGGP